MDKNQLYRSLPKVDVLLADEAIQPLCETYNRETVMEAIHDALDDVRDLIAGCEDEAAIEEAIRQLPDQVKAKTEALQKTHMRPVINGTGTILHTNLGRAPVSRAHMERLTELVSGYSNLEYDLEAGKRGERYDHFSDLLCKLTGAEAAMAVNNNAAAVMLILSSLAKGGEVIVSRGELVEIGGKFRIPDVMEQSGATLVEVGTTNKTHYEDYENAITEETRAILKVHTSNYRIVGFTESVGMEELKRLADAHGLPLIEDLGSGALVDLEKYGLSYEPTVQASIAHGADVVCFSGDKLLGGPQAGIIVGKKQYIDQMKKNQLTRALRIDKFTAGALELTLRDYISEEQAIQNVPVLHMITRTLEDVTAQAEELCATIQAAGVPGQIQTEPCQSQIGGGSLPLEEIPSRAVTIKREDIPAEALEKKLLSLPVPIVPRVTSDRVWLDVRTIERKQHALIAEELQTL